MARGGGRCALVAELGSAGTEPGRYMGGPAWGAWRVVFGLFLIPSYVGTVLIGCWVGVFVDLAGVGGAEWTEAEKAGWGTRTGGRATSGTRVPDGRRGRRPLHEDVRHPDESGHAQTGRYKDRSLTVAALIARRAAGRYNLTG